MKNVNKESRIWKWVLSTCAIAAITAGAGVGVGYAVWHNEITTPQPPNVKKDLFFTTGDTITTPNSKKSFYGTVYASNFTLSDDLKVKVDGNTSST